MSGKAFPSALEEVFRIVGRPKPNGKQTEQKRFLVAYDYTDEDGKVLFQCVRYYPKDFRQRRPDGKGGWVWNLEGVPRVLYRLPRLKDAQQVLVVEGEKDVHALERFGFVATCNPMGAGKWRHEYSNTLSGKDVVIVPDQDEPGRKHAEQVSKSLAGKARSVRIIPPIGEGKDVSDWINNGATREAIDEAIRSAVPEVMAEDAEEVIHRAEKATASTKKDSQASQLVKIGMESELYHTPDGMPYARMAVNGHCEDWPTNSKAFRESLARAFYLQTASAPGSQSIRDAVATLDGIARFDGPEHVVHIRVAGDDKCIYLDLCNESREVAKVTAGGWEIVAESPVRFRRPAGMLALPTPVKGGEWSAIKPFINVARDSDYSLILSSEVSAIRLNRPFPILYFLGEHGSAKSTDSHVVKILIDPCVATLRAMPRNERDLVIAASQCRILAYDNVSKIDDWLSDAFCRLATGGGLATRALYTDSDEVLFDVMRPVVMNGIEQAAWRGDFLDRSLIIDTKVISDSERKDVATFWGDFNKAWPKLLGVVLNGVSAALRGLETTKLEKKPRMADFAIFSTAAEPGLGFENGTFMKAYEENRGVTVESTLEAYPISPYVMKLVDTDGSFSGTFTELLMKLNLLQGEDKKPKYWPESTRKLSADMKRLAPALRAKGVSYTVSEPGHAGKRTVTLLKSGVETSPTSPTSPSATPVIENTQQNLPDVSPATSPISAETSPTSATPPPATSPGQVVENAESGGVGDVGDVFPLLFQSGAANDPGDDEDDFVEVEI